VSKLKIKLLKDKPHKVYSTYIEIDYHVEELCNFLRKHKDRVLEIIINGKRTKFSSIASRKKFVEGFQRAGNIAFGHVKSFSAGSQEAINKLINEVTQIKQSTTKIKEENYHLKSRILSYNTVSKLRIIAWEDSIQEYKDACEIQKKRLDSIEPVIDIIRTATSEGDLNKAALKVKKNKL